MKVKAPSGPTIKSTALLAGGALAAGAASKGIFGLLHTPEKVDASAILKEYETPKRVALMAIGLAAMMYAPKGDAGDAVKGAGLGVTIAQGFEVIASIASKAGVTPEAQATSAASKFMARAAGLGCPCNQSVGSLGNSFMPRFEMYDQFAPAASFNAGGGSSWSHPVAMAVEQSGFAA